MSLTPTPPPYVFGDEPKYVAIRLDPPEIRSPLSSSGLHTIANWPGEWIWMMISDAAGKLTAQPTEPASGGSNVPKTDEHVHTATIGTGDTVYIDKLYGPTIFANLEITADFDRGWVIKREGRKGMDEWVTIPAQLDADFAEEEALK